MSGRQGKELRFRERGRKPPFSFGGQGDGPRISFGPVYRFDADASDLQAEIRANLVAQAHRELEDMVIVRSEADAERAGAVP